MSDNGMRPPSRFSAWAIPFLVSAAVSVSPAMAADSGHPIPDLSGRWGRDMLFLEPPLSGPGPVVRAERKADGTMAVQDPCCRFVPQWLGDHTSPILKPEAAEAVKKFGDLSFSGTVTPDLHNTCWPEPPPFVLGTHFAAQILQLRDEVTLLYLINTVRHVPLNAPHPENLTPSCQGHSVGWYEGDTLVIDTVGIKAAPLSTIDLFGTPHSKALHVVERYRLIDGEDAAETQRKHGAILRPGFSPYGRTPIDPDRAKKGLQVEFTVEDANVFTTPWSGREGKAGPDELARKMGVAPAVASRHISDLGDMDRYKRPGHGLVEQRMDIMDRRNRPVRLTPKGVAFLHRLLRASR